MDNGDPWEMVDSSETLGGPQRIVRTSGWVKPSGKWIAAAPSPWVVPKHFISLVKVGPFIVVIFALKEGGEGKKKSLSRKSQGRRMVDRGFMIED